MNQMSAKAKDVVMVIDKPHFKVVLHETRLEVDLKEGIRKELEEFIESRSLIRESIGFLFQTIIPLDVALKDIENAKVAEKGVKIVIPLRKDIFIPLKPKESEKLVEKLNELISIEKAKHVKEMKETEQTELEATGRQTKAYDSIRRQTIDR